MQILDIHSPGSGVVRPRRGGVHVAAATVVVLLLPLLFLRPALKAFSSPPPSPVSSSAHRRLSYRPHDSHAPSQNPPLASQRGRRLGVAPDHVVPGAAGAASPAPHRRTREGGLRDPHLGAAAAYPAKTAAATAAAAAAGAAAAAAGSRFRPATADAGAALESGPAAAAVPGADLLELLLQGPRPQLLRPPRVEGPLGPALLRVRRPLREMLVRALPP